MLHHLNAISLVTWKDFLVFVINETLLVFFDPINKRFSDWKSGMNIEFYELFKDSEDAYRLIVTTREKTLVCRLRRTSKGYQLTPDAEINFELGPKGCLYSALKVDETTVLIAADSFLYRLDLNPI